MVADGGALRAVDDGVTRRLKALACTAPLHDLDTRKTRLDWVDASRYQMAEIALQAIDQVTLAMDFDHGADQAQVVKRLRPFVAAQVPDAPAGEHERVAQWVIENLINVGSLDRGFQVDYGTFTEDGRYVRRRFDFKLLVEVAAPDGDVYLRASDEAINVLVGALDTDVESAQVAAEVKLENLINRGRLGDARLAAEQARYRTVQYAEALRQKLDATRRDVRSVDWLTTVLAEEALGGPAALSPTPLQRVAGTVAHAVGLPTRFAVEQVNRAVQTVYRTGEQVTGVVGDVAGRAAQLGSGTREVATAGRDAALHQAERVARRDGADTVAAAVHETRADMGTVAASELPIKHYEEMTAQQAIAALRELTDPDELRTMIAFEERHKNRSGVISAAQTHFAVAAKDETDR